MRPNVNHLPVKDPLEQIIEGCKRGDRRAQRQLYERFAPEMYALCRRYVRDEQAAEDLVAEGFYKALTRLHQYEGSGSFEGWLRRIFVNEALMYLRRQRMQWQSPDEAPPAALSDRPVAESRLAAEEILALLDELPPGYRAVFNLYAIEGFKHREIADMLGISINTSKSQLLLARKRLQELLAKRHGYKR